MSLHLVGETLDARRAHQRAQAGELVPLVRGVYADPGDVDATVLDHAVRIARYLYPRAYLSSISAQLLGPTRDGKLYISGARNQRTRLRSLEIVQKEAADKPSRVHDGGAPAAPPAPPPRAPPRPPAEHPPPIAGAPRREMAKRLVEEYGSPEK